MNWHLGQRLIAILLKRSGVGTAFPKLSDLKEDAASSVGQMGRREKLLGELTIGDMLGAEIGPLHRALVDKSEGMIFYVDYCDTATLKARWATDKSVDLTRLHVDAIWGERSLRGAIDQSEMALQLGLGGCRLSYVVASHVVEHVPDLITWFKEIESVLEKDGTVRLAVPDKRFTFDYLRRTSSITDVADAYIRKRRVPSGSRVLDFAFNMVSVDCGSAWADKLNREELLHGFTVQQAFELAADAESNGTYHDVHCWVFTPMSLTELFCELAAVGLLNFECQRIIDTSHNEFEFFVWMRPCCDKVQVIESWQRARNQLGGVANPIYVRATSPELPA